MEIENTDHHEPHFGVALCSVSSRLPHDLDSDMDTQLMIRAKSDDSESFSILLERNQQLIIKYLARIVQNQAVAEELAQDVFLRVYRSRAAYEANARFSTWLYRIATNAALNYFHDQKGSLKNVGLDANEGSRVQYEASDRAPLIEDSLVREAAADYVRRAVRALPPRLRAVVIMHKYEELSHAQIAFALGSTVPAVKSLLFRAYSALRIRLRSVPIDQHASREPQP